MRRMYYVKLLDRIYNLLITYEKQNDNFIASLDAIVMEISGNDEFDEIYQVKFRFKGLLNKYYEEGSLTHNDVRRAVLKSVDLIDRILSNWKE